MKMVSLYHITSWVITVELHCECIMNAWFIYEDFLFYVFVIKGLEEHKSTNNKSFVLIYLFTSLLTYLFDVMWSTESVKQKEFHLHSSTDFFIVLPLSQNLP